MVSRSYDINEKPRECGAGYGWILAMCFIIADLVGAGVMTLPLAFVKGGLVFGLSFSVICLFTNTIGANHLADCFVIMRRRWSVYRNEHCGRPYPEIALRAAGPKMETIIRLFIYANQIGMNIVLLLLAANNTSIFLVGNFDIHVHKCAAIVMIGVGLWPFVMPRSPMNFTWVGLMAAVASIISVLLIIFGAWNDAGECAPRASYSAAHTLESMSLSFGTIMFAYGGHSSYPTIQVDMRNPGDFKKSIFTSYLAIFFLLYMPVALTAYYVYGNSMVETVVGSLQIGWLQQTVNVAITLHSITTYIIVFCPVALEVEEWAKTPKAFGPGRFIIRTLLLVLTVFIALSVPRFGVLLDLMGGSMMTSMAMMFPALFNMLLRAGEERRKERISAGNVLAASEDDERASLRDVIKYVPRIVIAVNICVIVFGVFGGVCATGTAFVQLVGSEMETPCYVQYFRSGLLVPPVGGAVNCCGGGKNVSIHPAVDLSLYCARL